jgi:hypothetical protein
MKKLLLVGAILMGVATASQAGVSFRLGLPLPPLPLPGVVVTPPAPVYTQPYCPPTYDYAPGVVVEPYYYGYGYPYRHYYYRPHYYGHRYYGGHYGGHYYGGHHGRW